VKFGPVDTDIALLRVKKEIMEGKIYSPFGKFAAILKNRKILISLQPIDRF